MSRKMQSIRESLKGITEMSEAERADLKTNIRRDASMIEKDFSISTEGIIQAGLVPLGAGFGALAGGPVGAAVGFGVSVPGALFARWMGIPEGMGGFDFTIRIRKPNKYMFNKKVNRKRRSDLKLSDAYNAKKREDFLQRLENSILKPDVKITENGKIIDTRAARL